MHMIERMKDHEHFFLALFFYTILQWILRWTRHNRIELTEPSFRTVRLKCWYAWTYEMPRTSFINWIIRRSFLFKLMELFAIDTMAAIVFGIKHLNKYDETLCRVSVSFTSQDGKKKQIIFQLTKFKLNESHTFLNIIFKLFIYLAYEIVRLLGYDCTWHTIFDCNNIKSRIWYNSKPSEII